MKRRFSDEQIIGMIKEYEAGVKARDLCRKYGISDATFYKVNARNSPTRRWKHRHHRIGPLSHHK